MRALIISRRVSEGALPVDQTSCSIHNSAVRFQLRLSFQNPYTSDFERSDLTVANQSYSLDLPDRHDSSLKFSTWALTQRDYHFRAANKMAELYPDLKERPVKETICLFDVDGTLTPARLSGSVEMLRLLSELRHKCAIGFVGHVLSHVQHTCERNAILVHQVA